MILPLHFFASHPRLLPPHNSNDGGFNVVKNHFFAGMKSWNWWAWQIFRCLSPYLLLYFLGTTQRSILTSNTQRNPISRNDFHHHRWIPDQHDNRSKFSSKIKLDFFAPRPSFLHWRKLGQCPVFYFCTIRKVVIDFPPMQIKLWRLETKKSNPGRVFSACGQRIKGRSDPEHAKYKLDLHQ